jgi:hypothetical protein
MIEAVARELNGWVFGLFGAEGLLWYREHPLAYTLAVLLVAMALSGGGAWWCWRRARRGAAAFGRWSRLVRSRAGRRALTLAREIRGGSRRLKRAIGLGAADPAERREMLRVLERFVRGELAQSLDALQGWLAIGGAIRVRELERRLEEETQRWSVLPADSARGEAEQSLARIKQQLALARRATEDHRLLLQGLEEAAAAIRTLEAELLALGTARLPVLPTFRAQLDDLAESFRQQRAVHLEYPAR